MNRLFVVHKIPHFFVVSSIALFCFKFVKNSKCTLAFENQLGALGHWTSNEGLLPALVQKAANIHNKTHLWSSCSAHQQSFNKRWKSKIPAEIDILSSSNIAVLSILHGIHAVLVGDSLILQVFSALKWVFPFSKSNIYGTPEKNAKAKKIQCSGPISICFSSNCTSISRSFTVSYCRNNVLGPDFGSRIQNITALLKADLLIINSGIWYNDISDSANEKNLEARRNGDIHSWKPLSKTQYIKDLELFENQIFAFRYKNPEVFVLWVESTPQHFLEGTFYPNSNTSDGCHMFSKETLARARWRNSIASAVMDRAGVKVVPIFNLLATLHNSHPRSKDGKGYDCTHFCDPSIAQIEVTQSLMNSIFIRQTRQRRKAF